MIKVSAVAIAGVVISLVVRKNSPEMALLLTIALALLALFFAFHVVSTITDYLQFLAGLSGFSPVILTIVLKTVGIGVLSKLVSDVCRDAGQSSVASGVEFTGAVVAVYIALPLFKTVVSMIESLV